MIHEYRLTFTTPVHFGLEGIGQERIEDIVRSDTLWGAIIQQWLMLYPQEDPAQLCQKSPFSLSSCFPLINDVPFYPLPLKALDHLFNDIAKSKKPYPSFKDLKGIRFISKDIFLKAITGEELSLADIKPDTAFPLPRDPYASDSGRENGFYSTSQRPRLRINQLCGGSADGEFFYCSDQYFNSAGNNGLFFLAAFENEKAKERFEAALRLLGDVGLGGDRSIGRGAFTPSQAIFSGLPVSADGELHLLLSLYHPTKTEVEGGIMREPGAAYSLIRRSGYAAAPAVSSYRRSDLWMIQEGAVFTTKPEGDVPCVLEKSDTVPHAVYRCGRAFSIPVKLYEQPEGGRP